MTLAQHVDVLGLGSRVVRVKCSCARVKRHHCDIQSCFHADAVKRNKDHLPYPHEGLLHHRNPNNGNHNSNTNSNIGNNSINYIATALASLANCEARSQNLNPKPTELQTGNLQL